MAPASTFISMSGNGSFASNFENLEFNHSFIGQESEQQEERHLKIQSETQVIKIFVS